MMEEVSNDASAITAFVADAEYAAERLYLCFEAISFFTASLS